VNHPGGGQHVQEKLVLDKVFSQGQEGAGLVLGKEEPGAGGSRNLPIKSWACCQIPGPPYNTGTS